MKTTTTTKVQSTQEVNTSYGLKNCCKGKLILIPTDKQLEVGLLAQSKSIPEKFTILNHATVEAFKNEPTCGWQVIDPIIIADFNERPSYGTGIKLDCMVYDSHYKAIKDYNVGLSGYKILAMPENISPKQLQAIADGKMRDGSEVLVGCEKIYNTHGSTKKELQDNETISYNVETDLKGYITLHKAKDETWDDIYKRINTVEFNSKVEVFNYLKKHYHSPKRLS